MPLNKTTKILVPTFSVISIAIYSFGGNSEIPNKSKINIFEKNESDNITSNPKIQEIIENGDATFELTSEKKEDQKRRDKEIAYKAFGKIDDYSFRIFSPCDVGTGWVLDYELAPEGKYPTTWYIATVAHAINKYRFSNDSYGQILPYSSYSETRKLRSQNKNDYSKYSLYGDNEKACKWVEKYGYFDMNIGKSSNGEELKTDLGGVSNKKIQEPKLFFAAVDLFEENKELDISKNNYKDFAVLEITFNDENYARKVTNGFADRYKVDTQDAINIFAKPLDTQYNDEQLNNLEENFFNFSYPVKGYDKYGHTVSWDEERGEGYKLANDYWGIYHNKDQKRVRGYGDSRKIWTINWGGQEKQHFGHFYLLDIDRKYNLGGGASGGLVTDKNGNVLGLYGGSQDEGTNAAIIPLRANEKRGNNDIKSPAYDLILGAPKQKTSYKEQVERYGKNTWLNARKWMHKA